jgi:hypothetical protein
MQQAVRCDVQQPTANGRREHGARPARSDLDRRSILLVTKRDQDREGRYGAMESRHLICSSDS